MAYPKQYRYTKEHEWVDARGDLATIGITDYAQHELGDVVFVELPKPGTKLAAVVELLSNPNGITIEEMQERFGWSRVTCSTVLSGDLPSKFGVRGKRGPDGRYRLAKVERIATSKLAHAAT